VWDVLFGPAPKIEYLSPVKSRSCPKTMAELTLLSSPHTGIVMPSNAYQRFCTNSLRDAKQLISAHEKICGTGPGKKSGAYLTSSGVVLLCAGLEAYVEDVVKEAATKLVDRRKASTLPKRSWDLLANYVSSDEKLFDFAKNWKETFQQSVQERVGQFSGPKHERVRDLVSDVLGHPGLIQSWDLGESQKLDAFVEKRNQIAHGEDIPYVKKSDLENYIRTVSSIALATDNWICDQLKSSVGKRPWNKISNQTSKKLAA
jgi:hypothetical protein